MRLALLPAVAMMAAGAPSAQAWTFETENWKGYWDNTLTYNLGFRARGIDNKIGNDPAFDESDYKFNKRGDVVTNRFSLLTELGGTYRDNLTLRLSAQGWHDFAYDDEVKGNPDLRGVAPPAYANGKYRSGVKNEHVSGGRLLDAFVQYSDSLGGTAYTTRLGRNTQYWGNGMFFATQSISYSQGAVDGIAGSTAPGTPTKALFLPRNQVNLSTQLTPSFGLGLQYFLERAENVLPQGGTYRAPSDFLFTGQDSLLGVPRGSTERADDINDNFGIAAFWQVTPDTTLGFYYRRLDEVQPWAPLMKLDGGAPSYFLAYNQDVNLYGISLDAPLGNSSLGMELSYRDGTALNSTPGFVADDPKRGATGDVVNLLANVLVPLGSTPFYEAGTFIAELAHTRVLSVDSKNKMLYNGTGYDGCDGGKWRGCSTRSATALSLSFTPEWIQVFPGIDLSMPTSLTTGLKGNPGVLGGTAQGSYTFSIGVQAKYLANHTLKVEYIGSRARTGDTIVNAFGLPQYEGGNGPYMLNDRDWISITAQTVF
ncbi:DUF1302 domain-containing protein [Pseudomonas aeruginosa]|uniref:DUF1302 domain-containing protein n=1 Tax=Pseudomonas aeruginosa TaxID=287 RepID=UPI00053E9C84|nr:DUF1302 family protein [Pseudomonas aeruginosa]